MADYEAIVQLLSRHCFAHDNRDIKAFAECITKDYTIDASPKNRGLVGEQILKQYAEQWAKAAEAGEPWSRHVLTNSFIVEDRGDEAEVQSYLTRYIVDDDGVRLDTTTSLLETVVLEDGRWKLRKRIARMDSGPFRHIPG